jgi:outer membrane usher protein
LQPVPPSSPSPRPLFHAAIACLGGFGLASAAAAAEGGPPSLAAATIAMGASQPADGEPLLLEVFINGEPSGQVGEFMRRGRAILAEARELRDLGFAMPGDGPVDLAAAKGLSFRLDETTQQIFFTAAVEALAAHRLALARDVAAKPEPSRTGFLLNYDAVALADGAGAQANALVEARGFSGYFTASSRFLLGVGRAHGVARRLDTSIDYSDVAHLRRISAGDVVTSALAWNRPVRIGGIQVSTDFAMRPDLITYPLPTLQGKAAVASTVDVLVNGVRQLSEQVPAGPFYVPQLPIAAGAGSVSIEIRDALGRSSRITAATYATDALLASGLSSFSIEAGAVRSFYGTPRDRYGRFAATASYRRGFGAVTVEGHVEAAAELLSLGGGAAFTIGDFAVATAAASASARDGKFGGSAYAAIERQARDYRLSLVAQVADAHYADLAALAGDRMTRLFVQASGGVVLGGLGTFDLSYVYSDRRRPVHGPLEALGDADYGRRSRYSASTFGYSRSFGQRLLVSANGYRDFAGRQWGMMVNLSLGFGRRHQASANFASSGGRSQAGIDLRQTGTAPGELSWEVYAGRDPKARAFAQANIRTEVAMVGGGIDYANGKAMVQASASGSLVWADGALFAARPVRDSFAIVDAAGHAGVPVMQDNQEIGRTRRSGKLILTDLRAYDGNRIAIRVDALAMTETVAETELVLRPPQRAGVVARFALREEASVLLTLVDPGGRPIEIGAFARLAEGDAGEPVGYDGKLYLHGVAPHNRLEVELADGRRCRLTFEGPADRRQIAEIGPIVCDAA